MKKIALPTRNGNIDDHFGHCAFYTIITVNDNNEVAKTEIMMLAGNMGMGALNKLSSCGIEVVRGCSGPVMDVVEAYLKGELKDSGEACSHHGDDGHECHNH